MRASSAGPVVTHAPVPPARPAGARGRRARLPAGGALALAALLLGAASPAAAQQGVVAGAVLRAGTLAPIEGAQVQVDGTQLGATTDGAGRFRIAGIGAADSVTLQVRR